jgi:subtilisin family serine protease
MKKLLRISIAMSIASIGLAACGDVDDQNVSSDTGISEDVSALGAGQAKERYIVTFSDFSRRAAALQAAGAEVALELPEQASVAALMPAAAANGLMNHPDVESIEIDPKRYPSAQTVPYGIPMVQATDPAFSNASGAVKVCIIDSGLHTGHADLQGLPITGQSGTAWNQDGCGHGTHVAGTIAGVNNTTGVVGVAPNSVSLHIVRVFADNCDWSYASGLVGALNECRNAGAKVVSMSLGGTVKSNTEDSAFQSAYNAGVLSIAAAGNAGNTQTSYPAGYASVVSVAAVDSNKALGSFSQRNADVEIAAPGVAVLSSVPWSTPTLNVGSASYGGSLIEFAPQGAVSGALVNGGNCATTGAYSGKVVLCQRGDVSFYDKVANVKNSGGVAALIYNNVSGAFSGTLGTGNSSSITALSLSMEDGQALVADYLGQTASVNTVQAKPGTGYEAWDGTSMATPHVSGVAALIWSFNPAWTNAQIRTALTATAQDLGVAGRDSSFGYGLVQAKAALDYLQAGGGSGGGTCKPAGNSCSTGSECCSGSCSKVKKTCS